MVMTMKQTLGRPKVFIVKIDSDTSAFKYVSQRIDTCRVLSRTIMERYDTRRNVYITNQVDYDTKRDVHNMNNIQFDTSRKINTDVQTDSDTKRFVKSDVPVDGYSFWVNADGHSPVECIIFTNISYFPYPDKFVKVLLDANGNYGFLPLAPVGSEFDSGFRFTEDDGTVWQICTDVIYDLIDQLFINDNYFINMSSLNYVHHALRKVFNDDHVTKDSTKNCIYFKTMMASCGIHKMFVIGLDCKISWKNNNDKDDWTNTITLTTYNNGLNDTSFTGDEKHKADAMLVEFEQNKLYKIEFSNKHKGISYDATTEPIKNCIIFGKDVEKLLEKSSNYERLLKTQHYFTYDDIADDFVDAEPATSSYNKDMNDMKKMWLDHTVTKHHYNYYKLEDLSLSKYGVPEGVTPY